MNEHAHDSYIEQYEDSLSSMIREALDNLVVRRIDKAAFAVERKDNFNIWHIVDLSSDTPRCNCAWSIFIKHHDCMHILASKRFTEIDDIPF